jgi:putative aldouronate transport system substrate-binding protein
VANYAIVDGKIEGNVNTDTYREYLETMYQWGQEGILNLEGFTMTNDQYTSDLDSMKVGMFYGWAPYTYITAFENQQKYVAMAPVAAEGYTPLVGRSNPARANRNDFVISATSDYQLEMLRWWDFLSHDQDYAMFVNRGEEGLIYVKGDDGVYYANTPTEEDLIKFGYEKYTGNIGTSTFAASLGTVNNHPLIKDAIAPDVEKDPTNPTAVRRIAMDLTAPYFQAQYQSKAIVPAEIREELAFATDGLGDYINTFAAEAVMNGITDASWEAYLAELDAYGYDYYLEWNQKYFDGELIG